MIYMPHAWGWTGVWMWANPNLTVRRLCQIENAVHIASLERWIALVSELLDEDAA